MLPFQHLNVEPRKPSASAFDELAGEVEATPEVVEGRKWVSDQFYSTNRTLAAIRLAAGFSQAQLARQCGMEQPHISRYESGRHEPSISTAAVLARGLGLSLDEFALAWAATRAQAEASP